MRNATLIALVRTPLLAPDDLALLRGIAPRVARRALDARVRAGEAGDVVDPATRCHLYYPTAAGVKVAAQLLKNEPEEIVGRYGLSERALLRRLAALPRLRAGRIVLLRLADAGGALEEWRAYPVRWPYTRSGYWETLVLDGEATLHFPDGARCVVGFLWDGDADAPEDVLALRLERLAAARACPAFLSQASPQAVRVPPVLLVTTKAHRLAPDAQRHPLALPPVAVGAGPGVVVDVIGSAPTRLRCDARQAPPHICVPQVCGDDMLDVESASGGEQAVLAGVMGAQAHDCAHLAVLGAVDATAA